MNILDLWTGKLREYGGAAIEYVLVTTFATLTGLAALTFVGKMAKEKMSTIAERLGIEIDDIDWNPLDIGNE